MLALLFLSVPQNLHVLKNKPSLAVVASVSWAFPKMLQRLLVLLPPPPALVCPPRLNIAYYHSVEFLTRGRLFSRAHKIVLRGTTSLGFPRDYLPNI